MEYKLFQCNHENYATNLKMNYASNKIMWDVSKGMNTLIVQTPFGCNVNSVLRCLCDTLSQGNREFQAYGGVYKEIIEGIWIRYVPIEEKTVNGGCTINRKASTYTVLACKMEEGICKIYEPYEEGMNFAHCDIKLEIHIDIQEQTEVVGRFRKREVFTGFYTMTFPKELKNAYVEGSLSYKAGNLEIPVTREMVDQGKVYIETDDKPVAIPQNKGIVLI